MRGLAIRPYREEDADAVARVFHRAVRHGTGPHYSLPQRMAWSPRVRPGADWHARLERLDTVVADVQGRPVGFMALDIGEAFLDFAYVDPSVQGRGIAAALYAVLEGRARAAGLACVETEASRVAEPFFAARGWVVLRRQRVPRNWLRLPNAVMQKRLSAGEAAA
jgi:putative acetyltransferase